MQYSIVRKPSAELNIFQTLIIQLANLLCKVTTHHLEGEGNRRSNFSLISFLKIGRQVCFTHHTDAVPLFLKGCFISAAVYTHFMIPIQKSLADRRVSNFKKQRHYEFCVLALSLCTPTRANHWTACNLSFFSTQTLKLTKAKEPGV